MQPLANVGALGGIPTASLIEEFRKELSKTFGTEAQLLQKPDGTYIVIPLSEAMVKQIITSRMSPEYAGATDVKVENGVVKVILRVL